MNYLNTWIQVAYIFQKQPLMEIGHYGASGQNALLYAMVEKNQDLEFVTLLRHQEGERIAQGHQAKSKYVTQRAALVSILISDIL